VTSSTLTAGTPVTGPGAAFGPSTMRLLEELGFFSGVGVLIVFFAALALGKQLVRAAAGGWDYGTRISPALEREDEYGPAY
jgi:hypothetical protein